MAGGKAVQKPLLSVIVPNYQGREIFPACIRSLLAQDYHPLQIVFVDDGSTDDSLSHARELFGKNRAVTIVSTGKNIGYVGACNHALKSCKGEYILFSNNDATFAKDWASEMYRMVEGKTKVIGGTAVAHSPKDTKSDKEFKRGWTGAATLVGTYSSRRLSPLERKNDVFELHAAGMIILPRSALGDYIFHHDYFAYAEDMELCGRLRLQGYSIVVNRRAKMYHYSSYTREKVPSFNKLAIYHGTKNRVRNFFLFYERKNLFKLFLPFFFMEGSIFLSRPRRIPICFKSYWWVLTHWREIMRHRKSLQSTRKVDDKEYMRLMSYCLLHENIASTPFRRRLLLIANGAMRVYCRIVRIRTFDLDDRSAIPVLNDAGLTPASIR